MTETFQSASVPDLDDREVRYALTAAAARVRARFGEGIDGHVGGRDLPAERRFTSDAPAEPNAVIGYIAAATTRDVDDALAAAWEAQAAWAATSDLERAALLDRVAEGMRSAAHDLAATVLHETGKSWGEAVGEVAEAIDFLTFHRYALARLRTQERTAVFPHPREENRYRHLPLGAGASLTPWPFPIAQITAMVSAAVVTGNAVVVKPASHAPVTARRVLDVWRAAGTPPGLLNVLFGPGNDVGYALATHPRTRFVTLTGSQATGALVHAAAAAPHPQRRWFTRVTLELAGKNPVVVDDSADLDAAAAGIVAGAFGFQGQKCSAGSRAIVVGSVRSALTERILARVQALKVGPPLEFGIDFGPLIDDEAVARTLGETARAGAEGATILAGGRRGKLGGRFVEPTVIGDVTRDMRIAREEVMGPLLAIIAARDLTEALAIANDTTGGLTGSVYAQDPARLAHAADTLRVGTVYLNRKPTASEVGYHPFGGFGMSGTDAKAGGPDYLLHYVQPQVVTRHRG